MYIGKKLACNKGITLLTLTITVVIMVIISATVAINFSSYIERRDFTNFQTDIKKLKEEISHYYVQNLELPIANEYTNIEKLERLEELEVLSLNDNDTYYVIDLDKLEGIKLKNGNDFYTIQDKTVDIDNLEDLYIINQQSHTIYYPKGIKYKNRNYYAIGTDDDEIGNETVAKVQIQKQNSSYLFGVKYTVTVTETDNLDYSNCKYKFTNSKEKIGTDVSLYTDGNISTNTVTIEKAKGPGNWYLHVLLTDNDGIKQEIVSDDYTVVDKEANFDYTGSEQTASLLPGEYKLETWGAQGGAYNETVYGGYGGYSIGNITSNSNMTLYINVGGQGGIGSAEPRINLPENPDAGWIPGGYNGGGNAGAYRYGAAGGGATHIATQSGLLKNLSSYKDTAGTNLSSEILIVAGGGGGTCNSTDSGGSGGGYVGKDKTSATYNFTANGGSQTSAGETSQYTTIGGFGYGAFNSSLEHGTSGGGGGFYGGGAAWDGPGAGGSGYIGNPLLTAKHMAGYQVQTSDDINTKTISTNNVSLTPISDYAKKGNGYARITNMIDSKYNYHRNTENELLATIHDRNYYKYNDEDAICAIICFKDGGNIWKIPLLVSQYEDAVKFKTSYNSTILGYVSTINYNGKTYYISSNEYAMRGYLEHTSELITLNTTDNPFNTLNDAAKALLDKYFEK